MGPSRGSNMHFTGERYVSSLDWPEISYEHWHRYLYARQFVTGKVVLDVASGEGYGCHLLAESAARVIGVDVDPESVRFAADCFRRENLEFRCGPAQTIPVEGRHVFDVITSFETLEHLDENAQRLFLDEVRRLLAPGGIFLVSTPNKLFYSDQRNYRNPFHLNEFYEENYCLLLRSRFRYVHLLGQRVFPVSYIWVRGGTSLPMAESQIAFDGKEFRPVEGDRKELLYMIAACSDTDNVHPVPAILLDITDRAMRSRDEALAHKTRELETMWQALEKLQLQADQQARHLVRLNESVRFLEQFLLVVLERSSPDLKKRLEYHQLIVRVRELVRGAAPPDATLVVASKGDDALLDFDGRTAWHFPRTRDGAYSGSHPACSASAVAQLEALRDRGATHFLLPATMAWWLDFYSGLRQHLEQNYKAVIRRDDTCVIYSLRERPPDIGPDGSSVMRSVIERCRDALGHEPSILNWDGDTGLAKVFPEIAVFSPPEPAVSLPYLDRSVDIVAIPRSDPDRLAEARRVAAAAVVSMGPEAIAEGDEGATVDWRMDKAAGSPSVSVLVLCDGSPASPVHPTDMQVALPDGLRGETILVRDAGAIGRLAEGTTGDVLVFLAAGTIPLWDWLTPLLTLFKVNPMLGTAGAKLIDLEGRLFSAGDVVFADASILGFGQGDHDPDAPLYSHVREVDSCPSRLFATRRSLFQEMGGLDTSFRTWPYQVADYCLRGHAQGYRSLFQPESVAVVHDACLAYDRPDEETRADQARFRERWGRQLKRHPSRPFHLDRDSWFALPFPGELEGLIPS